MPYVHVRITREGDTSPQRKTELIRGMTDVLQNVLGKDPKTTFVGIEEVDLENWGIGGLPVEQYRRQGATES